MKRVFKFIAPVVIAFLSFGVFNHYYNDPDTPQLQVITTPAFTANIEETNWAITLDMSYFEHEARSVAISYNDVFYGVFSIRDTTIYLPILAAPRASLVITSLDDLGDPIETNEFTLGVPDGTDKGKLR